MEAKKDGVYQRVRASKIIQLLLLPVNSTWFIAVPFLMAMIANFFELELLIYYFVVAISSFILLFNHDTKPIIPFFIAMYFGTSRKNSPIASDTGLYQQPFALTTMGVLIGVVLICFTARVFLTGEYKRFRFKNLRMSIGLLFFGAALILGGSFSAEASWKNVLFGGVEFVAFSFIYLYFTVTIDWKRTGARYFAYVMFAMALLMCAELAWIYATVDGIIIEGVIDKGIIFTGWGIQNNIGGMIALALPFFYYLAIKERHGWIFIILAEAVFAAMLFTLCRTAIFVGIGIMVVGSVCACVLSKKRVMHFCVVGLSLSFGLFTLALFQEEFSQLFETMIDAGFGLSGREKIFAYGITQYVQNPIFGAGYFMDPNFEVYEMFVPGRYHNMFIQILASCGTFGAIAYLFHVQELVRVIIKKFNVNKLFLSLGIITLVAISLMDNHFFNIGPGLIYSAMLCFLEGETVKTLTPDKLIQASEIKWKYILKGK